MRRYESREERMVCSPRYSTSARHNQSGRFSGRSTAGSRRSEYNPSKTMTMRTSCTEIRTVTRAYAQLLEFSQEFMKTNTQKFLGEAFGQDLNNLTKKFDFFSQQIVSLFSAVRKTTTARTFSQSSPLYISAHDFSICWASFIEVVNTVAERGVSEYETEISQCFVSLFSLLSYLESKMRRRGFASREVFDFISKNKAELFQIQHKLADVMIISKESIIVDMKSQKHGEFFKSFVMQMNRLLDRTLPRDVITPVEVAKYKIDVSLACGTLAQIIKAIDVFHIQVSDIKTQIVLLNDELTKLNKMLNLPFTVELTVEERPAAEIDVQFE